MITGSCIDVYAKSSCRLPVDWQDTALIQSWKSTQLLDSDQEEKLTQVGEERTLTKTSENELAYYRKLVSVISMKKP